MTTTSSVSSSTGTTATTAATTGTTTSSTATTNPASIGSQLVTSLGLGTGLDMTNLATEIATATYATQNSNITTQLNQVSVEISQASQLKSDVITLATSMGSLVNQGGLAPTPSVTDSTVATASLPAGSAGSNSSYSLEVDTLASPQVLTSNAYASATSATGSGTLTINFGSISSSGGSSSFTQDTTKSPVTITVASGSTLTDVMNDINASGAGVTAYIANTAAGAELVMKGQTGADSAFTVSATENSGDPGLSSLAWDPSTGGTARLAESATDASFKLDGIAQTSSSNSIANAAPGLSLKLTGTNSGNPTTITYSDPSSNITTAMQNLTSALNSLVTEMNTDTTPAAAGSLANDPGAQKLQQALAALPGQTIMPNAASGAPKTLADLGLSVNKDGSFSLNATTLSNALSSNTSGVAAMFTNGLNGVYMTIENMSIAVTSTTDPGSLGGSVTNLTAKQTQLTTQQKAIATQQSALQTNLINQYAQANSSVATSKSTLSFLQNQVAAWNSPTGGLAGG